ncbi:hypothetical protein IBX73_10790 [candidate division WOR-3 bacterium]|nr:hypothetical protein [candidate division WOR-3 bacterium]
MADYARQQSWTPYEKALIYGSLMHVVHDLYAHTFIQSSRFGYGKCYDSDSALSKGILFYGETYHELFSSTHITDWGQFIKLLYASPLWKIQWFDSYYTDACNFFRIINLLTGQIETTWQDTNFVEVEKFVQAAQGIY